MTESYELPVLFTDDECKAYAAWGMKKEKVLVQCVVNGEEVAEYVDPRESLLDMLRNHLGLTSVKKGCEVGECGACTVIIDGETIDSCIYLAVWAEGKNIRTLKVLKKTEN